MFLFHFNEVQPKFRNTQNEMRVFYSPIFWVKELGTIRFLRRTFL